MTLSDIFNLLMAIFQFPKTILEFVKLLRKTPQERHEEIVKKIAEEAKRFEETGRPTW